MAKINWTTEAEDRLREIHDYIAQDKPAAAFHLVEQVFRRTQVLGSFPEVGHRHRTPSGREVRVLLWGHYRIVYVIKSDADIDIIGVFHGAMELDRYIP